MMADLKGVHQGINTVLKGKGKPELSEDDLVVMLFREVETIWPMMGYPPLVTPFSQYVKNVALMNIVSLVNGRERFSMIDPNTWDMLLGKAGKLPGPLAPVLVDLAKKEGKEFYYGNPQDNYPDALDSYRKEMKENGWDNGANDEELFELAMHDRQYRDYKSGQAKIRFVKEVEDKKNELERATSAKSSKEKILLSPETGIVLFYSGTTYTYTGDNDVLTAGQHVKKGDILFYVNNDKTYSEVMADRDGTIKSISVKRGAKIKKGDPVIEFE